MDPTYTERLLSGLLLRYFLTTILMEFGPRTVDELVAAVEREGFVLAGRPSKTVSDALRWEIAHGRVVRLRRATYGLGTIPRQTRSRITKRVEVLRARGHVRVGVRDERSALPFRPRHSDNRAVESRLSL